MLESSQQRTVFKPTSVPFLRFFLAVASRFRGRIAGVSIGPEMLCHKLKIVLGNRRNW